MSENIYTAISEIQANPPALLKDGRGQYGAYLTLGNLLDALIPELERRGVALVQVVSVQDSQPALTTRLYHSESDTFIEGTMYLMSSQASPQQQGSAITYARRYALTAMLGVCPDEDDDGQSATNAVRATTRRNPLGTQAEAAALVHDDNAEMVRPF